MRKQKTHAHSIDKLRRQIYPAQLRFLERLEKADSTIEEIMLDQKVRPEKLGRWLTESRFSRRFHQAMRLLKAKAISMESISRIRESRVKLVTSPRPTNPPKPHDTDLEAPYWKTGMSKRLTELHGSKEAVMEKIVHCLETGNEPPPPNKNRRGRFSDHDINDDVTASER